MTDYLIGIDVSSNNSSNWEDDAWDYCWVKATEGKSYANPEYARQLKVVRDRGKVAGHYHWLNNGDVTAQVNWFMANNDVQPGEMIACDWEDKSNPSTAQKDQFIKALQDRFPGSRVGLYCNRDWWLNHDTSSFFGDYLWIANYTSASDPGIQADWTFWQYTSSPYDKNRGRFADLAELKTWAAKGGTPPDPPDPIVTGVYYSTDYLFPMVKPDPKNTAGIKQGDKVEVTANGGLTARTLPGGPKTLDKNGEVLVRATGYQFDVTGPPSSGWITGGSNWYSSDYLKKVGTTPPPTPSKPSWSSKPTIILPMKDVPGSVSYLQALVHVNGVDTDDGEHYDPCWILAQDYENSGDLRFLKFHENGSYQSWMQVNDGGHGQTFSAYRSAAGNLYVWCGEDPAYRYPWQSSKKVSKSSGDKMDYKGARPVGSYEPYTGFRDASDTKETFYLFDRTDFTGNVNRTKPLKSVTVSKRTSYTQQSWAVSKDRIYRIMGSTNDNPPSGSKLHILDVFDWSGKLLLDRFDITAMSIDTTSDEPEGVTFTAAPGSVLAAKREGSSDKTKRSVPVWTLSGLP